MIYGFTERAEVYPIKVVYKKAKKIIVSIVRGGKINFIFNILSIVGNSKTGLTIKCSSLQADKIHS